MQQAETHAHTVVEPERLILDQHSGYMTLSGTESVAIIYNAKCCCMFKKYYNKTCSSKNLYTSMDVKNVFNHQV